MRSRRKVSTLVILGLAAVSIGGGASLAAERLARVERIPGSELKRVILTTKAAQRLAIETAAVREDPVLRWFMVEGRVEAMPAERTGDRSFVRVHLLDDPDKVMADPTRTQAHSRLIVSLKDDDDDDDAKQGKEKAKGIVKNRPPAVVIPTGRAPGIVRLPARPIPVAAVGDTATTPAMATSQDYDYEVTSADHGLSRASAHLSRLPIPTAARCKRSSRTPRCSTTSTETPGPTRILSRWSLCGIGSRSSSSKAVARFSSRGPPSARRL